jgi:hypothetical protein
MHSLSTYKCLPHTSSHPLCWVDAHWVKAFPKLTARPGTTALLGPLIGHNSILGPGWRDPTATRVLRAMDGLADKTNFDMFGPSTLLNNHSM